MMASQKGKSEYMLLEIGHKAQADMAAARQACKALLELQNDAEPVTRIQQLLGLEEADWVLTAIYFTKLVENGSIPEWNEYLDAAEKLGRAAAEPLPATLRWGKQGVELSPVCRDFLLMREPELPPCAKLILCEQKKVYHNGDVLNTVNAFLNRYADSRQLTAAAVLLTGAKGSGKRFLLEQTAANLGGALLIVKPELAQDEELSELALAGALYNALLCIEDYTEKDRWILAALGRRAPIALLAAEKSCPVPERMVLQREIKEITPQQRKNMMQDLFADVEISPEQWQQMAENFHLQPGAIWQTAAKFAAENLCSENDKITILQNLLRKADAPHFSGGAELLSTNKTLDDVVLPPAQRRVLDNICTFVKGGGRVYKEWGFEEKIPYGRGVSALFYGASGTGKTLAATALANELGLPLYRVDLSQLTSKYIGETQKNIGKIFDEAKKAGCILFFDEADALFSRRSEVSDAQDKYSNGEIAYLLQKTEQYEGVTILATNLLQNFDDAFRRRITFMVRFPLPDAALRKELWSSIFPAKAPLDDMDFDFLAEQFELSGAGIKNCAVYAAFMAMKQNKPIGMSHIIAAVKNEYDKIGKTIDPRLFELFSEEGAQS